MLLKCCKLLLALIGIFVLGLKLNKWATLSTGFLIPAIVLTLLLFYLNSGK